MIGVKVHTVDPRSLSHRQMYRSTARSPLAKLGVLERAAN